MKFSFLFEGQPVIAQEGDTIGAALWAQETKTFRHSPNAGTPRGMFCAMGVCQECVVRVDGRVRTACNTLARPDMDVRVFSLNQGDQAK
ncbi:(2Fe-2S)-binding protein [Pseudomonas azerbaijanoccidentalis]